MRNVFAVYETDRNLMKSSRVLIAVCTSQRGAVSLVLGQLLKSKAIKMQDIGEQRKTLAEQSQTQGFETNYLIEELSTNKVLK